MTRRKTHEEFIIDFQNRGNPNIEIIGRYTTCRNKIKVKCLIHNFEFESTPSQLLSRGSGCPICAHQLLVPEINSVAATHPELIKFFKNPDDALNIMAHSDRKVLLKCPDCGVEKEMVMGKLTARGFTCSVCNAGISYPNRLLRAFLEQVREQCIYIKYEYLVNTDNGRRLYDAYIVKDGLSYTIEMQGIQHYGGAWNRNRDIEAVKAEDAYKVQASISNGAIPIVIDARYSSFDFIVANIQNSILNSLFDMTLVDWELCEQIALSNTVRYVADCYLENPMSAYKLSQRVKLSHSATHKYLKRATELGWINYEPQKFINERNERMSYPVDVFDKDNIIIHTFANCRQAADTMQQLYNIKFDRSSIVRHAQKLPDVPYKGFYFRYAS